MNQNRFKNLVIGSGPGGAVIANLLAKSSQDTCLIDEGYEYTKDEFDGKFSNMLPKMWRNNGITPILGPSNLLFGEAKCLGGGSVINAGLIWRTPDFIVEEWKKNYNLNSFLNNFNEYFDIIEKKLNVQYDEFENNYNFNTKRIIFGAKKLNWKIEKSPRAFKNCLNNNDCSLGCPSGAKNSLLNNYIPEFKSYGGRIYTGLKLLEMSINNNQISKIKCFSNKENKIITLHAENIFLSTGSVQTPYILKKNKIKVFDSKLQFHANLRILSNFFDKAPSLISTFCTHEIKEFEKQGLIVIPSAYDKKYILSALTIFNDNIIKQFMENIYYGGFYVGQIKMSSKCRINYVPKFDQPLITFKLNSQDRNLIKFSILKIAELLFKSNSKEILLPFIDSKPLKNMFGINSFLDNINFSKLNLISVHGMSSCFNYINMNKNILMDNCRVDGIRNLYICDASILPTNLGQSPQGTIMAFAHEIANRIIHK